MSMTHGHAGSSWHRSQRRAVSLRGAARRRRETVRRSFGANDPHSDRRHRVRRRGIGTEMASVRDHAKEENLEVIAVYDPWRVARENAAAKAKEWFGTDAKQCRSVDELLGLADVDAVFISVARSLALDLEAATSGASTCRREADGDRHGELNRAYTTAKASGVVIQVGTQLRSTAVAMGCRELVKSATRPTLPHRAGTQRRRPYWHEHLNPDVRAEDLDWKTFAKGRTTKAFDPILYSAWYGYWEFSQGPVPQWAVHFLDTAHFIAGLGIPESCVCLGGVYTWKDEHAFTAPDQVQALWQYPEGLMISYTTNFGNSAGDMIRYCGDKGTLKLGWEDATYSADGGIHRDGSIRGENKVEPIEQTDHWVNWYRCMRDRKTPNASLDAGYQHAIASIMATMSYEKGRRARFDAAKRTISLD
jgi:predicted dehydrogenase